MSTTNHKPKHKPSSLTILEALSLAKEAGKNSPDTGLFEIWLKREGLEGRSPFVKGGLYKKYLEGFEEKMGRPLNPLSTSPGIHFLTEPYHYKGYDLWVDVDANYHYSGEPESTFDSLKDVRRFIDSLC